MREDLKISIAHLYPKLLNLYGDLGNIITLKKRCQWRGIEVEFENINIGDNVKFKILDIDNIRDILMQKGIKEELYSHKSELLAQRDDGAVFLGICGGYQLFGHYYQPHGKDKLSGLSLMDAYTVAGNKRFIGNVTVKMNAPFESVLVGFENHSGLTYLNGNTKPIGTVVIGNGNNGKDSTEGARFMNVFGTYMHGSFLPKNPSFADYLLELALCQDLEPLDDTIEINAHDSLISKPY